MKHPAESELALFAGGEMRPWKRWKVARHAAGCPECRREVEAFRGISEWVRESSREMPPGLPWGTLAAEMRANIRLGLAAGECVQAAGGGPRWFAWRRTAAFASVVVMVVAGWLLQTRTPQSGIGLPAEGVLLEATSGGIELKESGGVLALQHPGKGQVTVSAGVQGSMRARYVDADTGYVTINNVYAQ